MEAEQDQLAQLLQVGLMLIPGSWTFTEDISSVWKEQSSNTFPAILCEKRSAEIQTEDKQLMVTSQRVFFSSLLDVSLV